MSKIKEEEFKVVCRTCKHEKALPDGIKCKKCNPNSKNNYEVKKTK